jgi:5-methyltetrahydropteroyltriglutamate--homocysteine methyltransferase
MKRSTERVLTTHAGSLPRPEELTRLMWDKIDDKPVDENGLKAHVKQAVGEMVAKQRKAGIDIISDGEMSKYGFTNYVIQRYTGFGDESHFVATDLDDFPAVARRIFDNRGGAHLKLPCVVGPIELKDSDAVRTDIVNLKDALGGADPDGAFIPAATPGLMMFNFPNRYYSSPSAFLEAAAEVLRVEYQAIIAAGFNVQLDAPDLRCGVTASPTVRERWTCITMFRWRSRR